MGGCTFWSKDPTEPQDSLEGLCQGLGYWEVKVQYLIKGIYSAHLFGLA